MELLLIKQPYTLSFADNPIAFTLGIIPYSTLEQSQNLQIIIRIEVEDDYNTGIFIEAKESAFYPDTDGTATTDIHTILKAFLTQYIPPLIQALPVETGMTKRFRISYRLLLDNNLVDGTVITSSIFFVINGGFSYQEWHPKKYFTEIVPNQKPFLKYKVAKEFVFMDEIKYLSWLHANASFENVDVKVIVGFSDGTESDEIPLLSKYALQQWQSYIFPAGFTQLAIQTLVPAGKTAVWYKIFLDRFLLTGLPGGGTQHAYLGRRVDPQIFYIEYRKFYESKDLLYINSLSGIETIRLRGEVDAEAEYTRLNAEKVTAPEYFTQQILESGSENIYNAELEIFKGDTGFLAKDVLDRLRDLFTSRQVFEIKNNRLIPVNLINKNAKWFSNKQNLFSIPIDWQHAFTNEKYTPAGTIGTANTCPVVENFIVRQSGVTTLAIAWALETGYNKLQVDVNIDGAITSYYLTGNHGQKQITFANPAGPSETHPISVTAVTVCNDLVQPADVGPVTTVSLVVNGKVPPVAVDDYYEVFSNAEIEFPVSALANDYDNNPSPIAVVPASGATTNGGTYAIDAAGIITYTGNFSTFLTKYDYFTYTITQTDANPLTATATVHIHKKSSSGSGSSGLVFVKIETLNISRSTTGGVLTYSGEVFLSFYSDAAGTNAVDVTGLGLVIAVTKTITGTTPSVTTLTYAANGFQMRIYNGVINSSRPFPFNDLIFQLNFAVQPGTGYQPI